MIIRNIDTLEFGIDIENYNVTFKEFIQNLEQLKLLAQEEYKEVVLPINNVNLVVSKKGLGFYAYKLECKEFILCFSNKSVKNTPPISVKFLSEFLWEYGYIKAYEKFMNWFKIFNVKIIGNRVSRLDICLDTDQIKIYEQDIKNLVTRAKKLDRHYVDIDSDHFNGKKYSGFTVGKGSPLSCRVYNKSLEIRKSCKFWFNEIWKEYNVCDIVWRIEFQIRRKILKELNIDKVEDIEKNIDSIWTYLTEKWLMLKVPGNTKNNSRWKVDDRWELVQKGGIEYNSTPAIRSSVRKGNLEMLLDQCIGLFISISALSGENIPKNTYRLILKCMEEKEKRKGTTFQKLVEERKNKFIN